VQQNIVDIPSSDSGVCKRRVLATATNGPRRPSRPRVDRWARVRSSCVQCRVR
jgi:hypothetical protein